MRLPTVLFSLRLPEYVHCLCSVMYTLYCLIFLCIFSINITRKGTELYITKTAYGSSLLLPRSFRQASCCRNVKKFPTTTNFRGFSVLLLLCGDISLNPGPVSFGVINCRSVRNKGPTIADIVSSRSLDLLSITETHIRSNDTDSLLRSITPSGDKLCHRPHAHGHGGGVGFFVNHNIHFKIVGSPAFVIACVYRPPGSCSDAFCDEFFSLFEYLSSLSQNFLICGNFNIHVDTISKDSEKFLNCLESCNINQHVHKPTHLHGHTLDLILTPNDSSAVSNVRVSDFISDHALVLGQLDFTNPALPTSKTVTFRMFHRINMDCLRSDLENCSFVKCSGNTASVLYEQYTKDLSFFPYNKMYVYIWQPTRKEKF